MKKFLALLLALTMALALVACGGGDDAASDTTADSGDDAAASTGEFEEMTWKFACSATETSPWVDGAKEFARIVGEKTGGAITVQYYPADQLTAGNQTDGIQALMDGTTELSMHSNLIWSSFDQRFNVVSLPFLFSSTEEADAALDGAGGEALGEILESTYNVHLLGIAENGFRHITNSKHAIASKADMNGLKMRVAGSQLLNRSYELWGADYTNANWSEVFTALQTFIPIMYPVATQLGIDPVHFGVIATVNLAIGQVTPPVGVNLFVAIGVSEKLQGLRDKTKVTIVSMSKAVWPQIVACIIALLLITYVPWFSTVLLFGK